MVKAMAATSESATPAPLPPPAASADPLPPPEAGITTADPLPPPQAAGGGGSGASTSAPALPPEALQPAAGGVFGDVAPEIELEVIPMNVVRNGNSHVYHTEDEIRQLRIKAVLEKVHGPKREEEEPSSPGKKAADTAPFMWREEEKFEWQEKILGLHEDESVVGSGRMTGKRILFSRNHPSYRPHFAAETAASSSSSPMPEAQCGKIQKLLCCRFRHAPKRIFSAKVNETFRSGDSSYEHMQIYAVLDEQVDPAETGLVGSLLGAPTVQRFEVLLCELRAQKDKDRPPVALEVSPPFAFDQGDTKDKHARIEFFLPGGSKFRYWMENVSEKPTEDQKKKANADRQSMDARAFRLRSNLAGTGFESLSDTGVQYSVFGEIIAYEPDACGDLPPVNPCVARRMRPNAPNADTFDGDWEEESILRSMKPISLWSVLFRPFFYIAYELCLPTENGWRLSPVRRGASQEGRGASQEDSGSSSEGPRYTHWASPSGGFCFTERCVFNQPLEYQLINTNEGIGDQSSQRWICPRLVFQVQRVNSWSRHALEGYAFVDVPQFPGEYETWSRLWLPAGTRSQQVSSKLCGAYVSLASPFYVSSTELLQESGALPRNRSNLMTRTSRGRLHVRLQVVRRPISVAAKSHQFRNERQMKEIRNLTAAARGTGAIDPAAREGLRQRRLEAQKKAGQGVQGTPAKPAPLPPPAKGAPSLLS